MTAGLTEQGLNIMTYPEIVEEMKQILVEEFDGVEDIDLGDQSVNMQWINIMAKPQAVFWEKIQEVYNSQSPVNAEGISFDDIAQYIGLERLPAKSTLASVGINGTGGTVIPEGILITNNQNNQLFRFNAQYKISTLNVDNITNAYYEILTVENSTLYLISTVAGLVSYVSSVSATITEITNGLVASANSFPNISAVISGQNDTIIINYNGTTVVESISPNIKQYDVAFVESVETGSISAGIGSLTDIVNGITGFDSVYNFIPGQLGNDVETDAAFKARRNKSLSAVGAGTLPSMVARILDDVENVTQVSGFENRTKIIDAEGRPPSSFELLIDGGSDKDIGEKIWETKPAGIEPYSRTGDNYDVIDSNGNVQKMFWSRPVSFVASCQIAITFNPEEIFPSNGEDDIKNNIVEYGNSIEIGKDYIGDKFKAIVQKTPGVASSQFTFEKNGGGATVDFLEVDDFERGNWNISDVIII